MIAGRSCRLCGLHYFEKLGGFKTLAGLQVRIHQVSTYENFISQDPCSKSLPLARPRSVVTWPSLHGTVFVRLLQTCDDTRLVRIPSDFTTHFVDLEKHARL